MSKYKGFVLWGDHDQDSGKHVLLCQEKSAGKNWHHPINMSAQPLLIDANGDYVADIFGAPFNETEGPEESRKLRSIWTYSETREEPPTKIPYLKTMSQVQDFLRILYAFQDKKEVDFFKRSLSLHT